MRNGTAELGGIEDSYSNRHSQGGSEMKGTSNLKEPSVVEETKGATCDKCGATNLIECDSCGEELKGRGDLPYTGQQFWCVQNSGHYCGDCVDNARDESEVA
jgi:hypothetical protein